MSKPLTVNVEEYRFPGLYGEAVFYVRGLTVSEMIALNTIFESKERPSAQDFYRVGITTLVGWDNFQVWIDGELYELECLNSNIEKYIEPQHITEIGKYSLGSLTFLSDQEEKKYRGYVNMVFWISDDKKGDRNRESLNCEHCARTGLIMSRPCGRKDKSELIEKYHGKKDVERKLSSVELAKKKLGLKNKIRKSGVEKTAAELEEKRIRDAENAKTMVLGSFKYPECPVTWIPASIRTMADALWDCSKNSKTFFSSGVADQPHKIYQAEKIVGGEASRLESEEIKKQTK